MKTTYTIILFLILNIAYGQFSFNPNNNEEKLNLKAEKRVFLNTNSLNKGVTAFINKNERNANQNFFFSLGNYALKSDAYNNIGVLKALSGKPFASLYYFEKAKKLSNGISDEVNYNYFLSLAASGKYISAIWQSKEIEENNYSGLNYNKALNYSKIKDYANSEKYYYLSVNQNENTSKALYNMALDNFHNIDLIQSNEILSDLTSKKSTDYRPYLLAGIISATNYNFNNSKSLLKKAVGKEPDNINNLIAYVNSVASSGSGAGLITSYNKIKNILNPEAIDLYAIGNVEFVKGKINKAISTYKRASFKAPAQSAYLVGVANAYNKMDDYKNAVKYYQKAIATNFNDMYAQIGLGISEFKQENYYSAAYCFSNAMPLLLQLKNGYNTLIAAGYSFYAENNFSNAEIILSHAIEIDSTQDIAYGYRALVKYDSENLVGALEDINKAIKLNPYNHEYFELRGAIEQRNYQFKNAKKDFSKAVFLCQQSTFAKNGLALALSQLDNENRSLKIFNRLIKKVQDSYLYNNRAIVRDKVAESIRKNGNKILADSLNVLSISDIDLAYELEANEWFYVNMGNSLENMGQDSLAKFYYNKYYGPVANNNIGVLEANNGNFNKSAELIRLAIKQDSNYIAPKYNLEILKNKYGISSIYDDKKLDDNSSNISSILGMNENELYTTYFYHLPATIKAPSKVDFIPEFLYKDISYNDFVMDYQMVTNDLEVENKIIDNNVHVYSYKIGKSLEKIQSNINSILIKKHCPSYN